MQLSVGCECTCFNSVACSCRWDVDVLALTVLHAVVGGMWMYFALTVLHAVCFRWDVDVLALTVLHAVFGGMWMYLL